jgi:hypothetical protein
MSTSPELQSSQRSVSVDAETVPLKAWQKARLIWECIPVVSFLIMAALLFLFAGQLVKPSQVILFILFIGVVILVLGYQAVQRMRDLLSGVAIVQNDVLERSWASRRGKMYWGKFEGLGRFRLMPKAHFQSGNGARYRVTYSPVSRIVWTLEKIP